MFVLTKKEEGVIHLLIEGEIEKYDIVINNETVGTLSIVNNGGERLYIDHLFIFEEHRGKGYGTQVVNELFTDFPQDVKIIHGIAEEAVLDGFWKKQNGFRQTGEGYDETEGYLYFEITK